MVKLLTRFVPIIISFAAGALIRERMMNDMHALNDLIGDLRLMLPCIRLERKTLKETLSHLSLKGKLAAHWNELLRGLNSGENLGSLTANNDAFRALPASCAAEVQAYLASFGRGDAELETEKLNALIDKLAEKEKSIRSDRESRVKLVLPLSLMAGSVIALLMM